MISTPDRQNALSLIGEAATAGARQSVACTELGIDARTLRRWRGRADAPADRRPGAPRPAPSNKLTAVERAAVLATCNSAEFQSQPPSQIVPRLADRGIYIASEASFYRILREEDQQQHRGRAKAPGPRTPPTTHCARGPCQVWSWDITWLPGPIRGTFLYLYLILDIFSRKIVGWEVHERESGDLAADLVRKAVLAEGCVVTPLVLHADNGSPMKAATMKATLERLGVIASYSRPRVSDDNPFSEALFRTCKYRPNWPSNGFAGKAEAQAWVEGFVRWYNTEHRHSGIRFVTPEMRHSGNEVAILNGRASVYAAARAANPSRWTGRTRNWQPIGPVMLNPDRAALAAVGETEDQLSRSIGAPAFPPRPGSRRAAARSAGDGKRAATRSHAQRSEHGEDGEHCTFATASTVASSIQVERHAR